MCIECLQLLDVLTSFPLPIPGSRLLMGAVFSLGATSRWNLGTLCAKGTTGSADPRTALKVRKCNDRNTAVIIIILITNLQKRIIKEAHKTLCRLNVYFW